MGIGRGHTDVRISSKELFLYYHRGLDRGDKKVRVGGCTNKTILASRTGVDYYTLMKVFTRQDDCFYDDGTVVIMRFFTDSIEKGKQSRKRKGKGGMENFIKYIMTKE